MSSKRHSIVEVSGRGCVKPKRTYGNLQVEYLSGKLAGLGRPFGIGSVL